MDTLLKINIEATNQGSNQNIYITSDEEIKEDDWCMSLCDDESYEEIYQCKDVSLVDEEDKKIILTTDQDLIKDGVQEIDDEFLEYYISVPYGEIKEVEVEDNREMSNEFIELDTMPYKIIIPKEEPKQETLEEVAENFWLNDNSMTDNDRISYVNGFVQGAKWQQKLSYSQLDVVRILSKYETLSNEDFNKWFAKYKKK